MKVADDLVGWWVYALRRGLKILISQVSLMEASGSDDVDEWASQACSLERLNLISN